MKIKIKRTSKFFPVFVSGALMVSMVVITGVLSLAGVFTPNHAFSDMTVDQFEEGVLRNVTEVLYDMFSGINAEIPNPNYDHETYRFPGPDYYENYNNL